MSEIVLLIFLFFSKLLDNLLGTAKTLLVQHNKSVLAGVSLACSNFIYFYITKNIVTSDSFLSMIVVSIAGGIGCYLAITIKNHFSKDRTYVNVILSDNIEGMRNFRDFLAANKITNVINDSYDRDWNKTLSITAYAETKDQSKLIDEYIKNNDVKFKRFVQSKRVK